MGVNKKVLWISRRPLVGKSIINSRPYKYTERPRFIPLLLTQSINQQQQASITRLNSNQSPSKQLKQPCLSSSPPGTNLPLLPLPQLRPLAPQLMDPAQLPTR